MNTANPFQIPSCLQRADLQLRRQKRFQRIVVAVIAGSATLLVVLLIEGCMSEHAKTASTTAPIIGEAPATSTELAVAEPQAATTLSLNPVASASSTPSAPKQVSTQISAPVASASEAVYVVKPGDTLTRIAKLCRTTIKALKAANGLNGDTIAVGTKLKLPTA